MSELVSCATHSVVNCEGLADLNVGHFGSRTASRRASRSWKMVLDWTANDAQFGWYLEINDFDY